jgi:hypothetical protein
VGLIPHGVIGIYHGHNPSGRFIALGLIRPLTEFSTWYIYLGKCAGAYGYKTYNLNVGVKAAGA